MKHRSQFLNFVVTVSLASSLFMSSCTRPLNPPIKKDLVIIDKTDSEALPDKQQKVVSDSDKGPSQSTVPESAKVKIGIRINVESIIIQSMGKIKVTSTKKGALSTDIWPAGSYTFFADEGVLVVKGKRAQKVLTLSPVGNDPLQIKDRPYRGNFIVRVSNTKKITLVNELSIDDYLKGVLPLEAAVHWPLESLKVQAVASRTYLASHLGSHSSQGFDLCSDVHCQVYGGMAKEHPNCNEAVESTRREILVYQGKPVGAYFHSNCGGMTEHISKVWGRGDQVYLPRKKCIYGTKDPRYNWSMIYHGQEMLTLLKNKNLVQGSEFRGFKIKEKTASGRASFVTIKTDQGSFDLKANDFRIALHPEKIRSTKWTNIQELKGGYKFTGTGWGHGVGMCQWGAKGQSEAGKKYRQILQFYYPESKISVWDRSNG